VSSWFGLEIPAGQNSVNMFHRLTIEEMVQQWSARPAGANQSTLLS